MVIARGLAELTVLVILTLMPIFLMALGYFNKMHIVVRVILLVFCPLSLWGIWALAQIPFKLVITESELTARALLKKWTLGWTELSMIKLCNRYGLRQYVLTHAGGELSFPSLFNRSDELLRQIRAKLPNRGRSTAGDAQTFKMPAFAFALEIGKLLLQAGFAVLFFYFYFSLTKSSKSSQEDLLIVLLAAIVFAAAVIWKSWQTMRLPHEVKIDTDGLKLAGPCLKNKILSWNEVEKLESLSLLFPDGMRLCAGKKSYLIGANLDGFDELCEEISRRKPG